MIAADAARVTILQVGTHGQRVPGEGEAETEAVVSAAVGGLDIGLLRPYSIVTDEDVDGTGISQAVVTLVTVDTGRLAVLAVGSHGQRIAGQGKAVAELITTAAIGGLDIGLLGKFSRGLAGHHQGVTGGVHAVFSSDIDTDEVRADGQRDGCSGAA